MVHFVPEYPSHAYVSIFRIFLDDFKCFSTSCALWSHKGSTSHISGPNGFHHWFRLFPPPIFAQHTCMGCSQLDTSKTLLYSCVRIWFWDLDVNRDGVENKVRVNDRGSSGLNFNEDKKSLVFSTRQVSLVTILSFSVLQKQIQNWSLMLESKSINQSIDRQSLDQSLPASLSSSLTASFSLSLSIYLCLSLTHSPSGRVSVRYTRVN